MLDAVIEADAVVVVASHHDGRGMFVELGAALACDAVDEPKQIVVVGSIQRESIFYLHPRVQRVVTIDDWILLAG